MKILILTQKVDIHDDVLGFFHRWIEEFAKRFEKVTVVCLEKGVYNLPANVEVLSLGKEDGRSVLKYLLRFYSYIWRARHSYEAVFVHMNQEYVLLGGILWRALGKKILLWRNHPIGSFLTRIAVLFSHNVFCTSPFAYTAPFKKTSLMPVGIDTDDFKPIGGARLPDSIVFFGRIAPIKKPEILVDALAILKQKNILVSKTTLIGSSRSADHKYFSNLQEKISLAKLSEYIDFRPGLPHHDVPAVLSQFEAYINTTPTGSMDKTIFEAMACETVVIASNKALRGDIPDYLLFEEDNSESLSRSIEQLFLKTSTERRDLARKLRRYVIENHSLSALMDRLQAKCLIK